MTINENNYDGATVTLVGRAGGEAKTKNFDNGGSVTELSIAVSQGYKKDGEWQDTGTAWYTLTASGEYAKPLLAVGKGDKVRVDEARLEVREYKRADDSIGQQFVLRYGNLSIVESKGSSVPKGELAPAGADAPW